MSSSPQEGQEHHGTVQVASNPDIRIFYRCTHPVPIPPTETKPVLVLAASLASTTVLWDLLVREFADKYVILRYDARFHGQSPLVAATAENGYDYVTGHTLEDLASDVAVLLDHVGVQQAEAFIGLSIGASVGVILAATRPELFRRFIIVGTKAYAGPGDDATYDSRIALAKEHGFAAQAQQSVERWFSAAWIATHPDEAGAVANMVAAQSLDGFIASIAALRKLDLWPYADRIKGAGNGGKVIFVAGEDDSAVVVAETKQLAERAGSGASRLVEGAGHIVNVEQPARFHAIVREVLSQQ